MNETDDPDNRNTKAENKEKRRSRLRHYGRIVVSILVSLVIISGLAFASLYFKESSDRVKFLTESLLSTLIAVVVIIQAWIYNQQRKIMQEQKRMAAIAERAYIALSSFYINPVVDNNLIVTGKLVNGGRTPAYGLQSRNMTTLLSKGENAPTFIWESSPSKEGKSFLPAGGERNVDFPVLAGITRDRWDLLIAGELILTIKGECRYFDHIGDGQILAFGFTFDFSGERARGVEQYQRHYPQDAQN